jgi:hypothetical protein
MSASETPLVDVFKKLSLESYEAAVHEAHGEAGVDALVGLLANVRDLLTHVPHEMLTRGVVVIAPIDPTATTLTYEDGATVAKLSELAGRAVDALTVAVLGVAKFRVWLSHEVDVVSNGPVLIYRYVHQVVEEVVIDQTSWEINDTPWACKMAIPTFTEVEDALAKYVAENRIPVQCGHLSRTWRDDKRLAFLEKPEKHMRRSLIWALTLSVNDVNVRPEVGQGETKPVDVEITWLSIKRSAIIEIKWLGHSGPKDATTFSTSYTQARAVAGLRQVAEYLDIRDATDSTTPVMGYLMVFDARRRGLTATQSEINAEDGLHFAMSDPEYPADLINRPDMGRPFRCFMEPICT